MKMTPYTIKLEPAFKEYLDKQAQKKGTNLAKYIRAALKKGSGYKEKPIV